MTSETSDTKVLFRIPGDDGSGNIETLWATALGEDRYRLDNSPFDAYSVSWQDVIYAPFSKTEGFPTFENVLMKSGRMTVRVIFEEDTSSESPLMKGLLDRGCSFEGANRRCFSIDIPPDVSLEAVRDTLIASNLQWEHADPSYSELYPHDA